MISDRIEWDGTFLTGWVIVNGSQVQLRASRATIHSLSLYNDVLDWEIERFKEDIFNRLTSVLLQAAE